MESSATEPLDLVWAHSGGMRVLLLTSIGVLASCHDSSVSWKPEQTIQFTIEVPTRPSPKQLKLQVDLPKGFKNLMLEPTMSLDFRDPDNASATVSVHADWRTTEEIASDGGAGAWASRAKLTCTSRSDTAVLEKLSDGQSSVCRVGSPTVYSTFVERYWTIDQPGGRWELECDVPFNSKNDKDDWGRPSKAVVEQARVLCASVRPGT